MKYRTCLSTQKVLYSIKKDSLRIIQVVIYFLKKKKKRIFKADFSAGILFSDLLLQQDREKIAK